jgi:hypothetical protein
MTSEPWFKPKRFGYGNVPINWKGWAVTIAYALFVCGQVMAAEIGVLPPVWCVAFVLLATAVFIPFIKTKTSGQWRWRWGGTDR